MKVSYQWLNEYVDISNYTPEKLAELLTSAGLAVDGVEARNQGVEDVVVGLVTEVERHPDADRLNVCQVDVGQSERLQIVCGAPNVAPGMKVPVALPGAKLPGDKVITKAKLRGVTSNGMLCSASEIGLDTRLLPQEQTVGLYVLPDETPIGENIVKVLGLDDFIFDVDLTPNRSDCLSIRGLAYEIAALTGTATSFPTQVEVELPDTLSPVSVKVETELCSRYDAQVLTGLASKPSPLWMQMRLLSMGVRPIDVIVDVTNYVMLEWGQPLHAFDAEAIHDSTIVVRQASEDEQLQTLDGQKRTLDPEMIVIADPEKPIGLAGVMGGENSEISPSTTRIVLESARFDAVTTRRTGQKLGLRSEAQQRFEKGIDPAAVRNALLRAVQLLIELGGASPVGGIATAQSGESNSTLHRGVSFSPNACRNLLGCEIDDTTMKGLFHRLGFSVTTHDEDWTVSVPTRRPDISLQADLVEEVARLYGYDHIPSTLPTGPVTTGGRDERQLLVDSFRTSLVEQGLFEVRTYAFTSPEVLSALHVPQDELEPLYVPLLYPMSDERRVLRTHMLPSLAEVARHNLSHRVNGGAIFEIGRVYHAQETPIVRQPMEREYVSALWFGQTDESLYERTRTYDFFDAKGVIERLLGSLAICAKVRRANVPWLHPGRAAELVVGDTAIGLVGQVHPDTARDLDIAGAVYAELDIQALVQLQNPNTSVEALPRFPGSRRDLAVLVDTGIAAGDILDEIYAQAEQDEILRRAYVFDIYTGQGVQEGSKSVAMALFFGAQERTLTDEEIDLVMGRVLKRIEAKFDAKLRA